MKYENPERGAADLAAGSPDRGWEDWDEYSPKAARLRILAALTMFPIIAHGQIWDRTPGLDYRATSGYGCGPEKGCCN
jgi:hypothetical protein